MAHHASVVDAELSEAANRVDIVALVTSAGGLEALTAVVRELPPDFPAAVVVCQHLGGQGSMLVEILGRRVALPVEWAVDGGRIEAGRVTVCPPRSMLEVLPDGSCSVRPSEGRVFDRPLDALLASVGDSFGARALGVVLTGMGADGAAGAAAIRAAGGIVLAQSEDTAEQPAMPRAAIGSGAVDLVLPLHDLAAAVADIAAGKPLPRTDGEEEAIRLTFGERGPIARLAREIDWAGTPLGAVSEWPSAQRAVVRLAMDSPNGVTLFLGPDHILLSNEAAIEPTGGPDAHARVFAQPYVDTYPEAVEYMLPLLARVLGGEHVRQEGACVPFERHGRLEDVWFDFNYTPIRSADGAVLGVQQTFLERTDEVVRGRRLSTLNVLSSLRPEDGRLEAIVAAVDALADAEDVPFAAAYLIARGLAEASLLTVRGVEEGSGLAPQRLRRQGAVWPLERVLEDGGNVVVDDVERRFRGQRVGAEELALEHATLHAIRDDASGDVVAVLVLGVHPRVRFDQDYIDFLALAGDTVAAKANEAEARQRERQRLERLQELDRAKTEFFSNISHEFRTPLTLMLGPLEELTHDGAGLLPEQKADIDLVRRNTHRLLRLVGTMLDFSQMEAGRLRARFAPVDLVERTREIVAQFESAAARAGVELRVDLDDLQGPVWVDVEMWEKIVSNLLSNALKFTFDGAIDVTLRALPKHAELVVCDTGVGIPAEELPHIFKRFHRVRDTRARTYEGAGIGLALVDELVRRHHGRIRAASTVGEGATFTVWIPLGRRPTMPEAPPTEPPRTTAVAAAIAEEALLWGDTPDHQLVADDDSALRQSLRAFAPGARVLVADDNKDMRAYLQRLLSPQWKVETAADGTSALARARRNPPDLIVADMMMPGLDGFALLRELRHDPSLKSLPVVLVTARAGEESAIEGLLAGADDYIVKPFSARELVARVGGQLELARARARAFELNEFLVRFSDTARGLADPRAVAETACRMLITQLGATRTTWSEVDHETQEYVADPVLVGDGTSGEATRWRLDPGEPYTAEHLAGRTVVYMDSANDPRISDATKREMEKLGLRSGIAVPVCVDGELRAVISVSHEDPRVWAAEEIALVEALAGRAWAELERARSEAALRESEAHLAAELDDARVLQKISNELVSEAHANGHYDHIVEAARTLMRSDAASIQELDATDSRLKLLAHTGFHPESAAFWEFVDADVGTSCGRALTANERVLVPNMDEFDADPRDVAAYRKSGIMSVQSTPLVASSGRIVGMISTHWNRPHTPSAESYRFFDILTRLAADFMERTYAKTALHESEEKYRTLFESMGQGYSEIEMIHGPDGRPIDHRLIELNPAFERLTGIRITDAIGRTATEVTPGIDPWWFETYDRIAHQGASERFEYELTELGRWYEVHCFPQGGERLTVFYEDITERKLAEQSLRESAERQAFLLKLSDALRPLGDPAAVKETAARLVGEHLGANRCLYAEIDGDDWLISDAYERDVPPIPLGRHEIAQFGDWIIETHRAGKLHVFDDLGSDERFDAAQREAHAALSIQAGFAVPLVKDSTLIAVLTVHSATPRTWTEQEIALAEEVAERTWAAVELARSERALRERED